MVAYCLMTGVDYLVSLPDPATHEIAVTATIPAGAGPSVEVFLPVWTPGSYLVREYSRHVLSFEAEAADGRRLPVAKSAKNRWTVGPLDGESHVVVRYRLYAREMSVRTNFVDPEFALIVGAATFVTTDAARTEPHAVRLEIPEGWTSHTSLDGDGAAHRYTAPDFDSLVDSPIACGRAVVSRFTAGDRTHELVDLGDTAAWNAAGRRVPCSRSSRPTTPSGRPCRTTATSSSISSPSRAAASSTPRPRC